APVKRAVVRALESRVRGPGERARAAGRTHVWAMAEDAAGRTVQAWLETTDGYAFTAVAGVRCIERILEGKVNGGAGVLTPAQAFGADFVLEIEGTERYDVAPKAPEKGT
ncbi:MAG: saccharopine dehydrogenase family protein, partial [Polyangiaceae bacterium]